MWSVKRTFRHVVYRKFAFGPMTSGTSMGECVNAAQVWDTSTRLATPLRTVGSAAVAKAGGDAVERELNASCYSFFGVT